VRIGGWSRRTTSPIRGPSRPADVAAVPAPAPRPARPTPQTVRAPKLLPRATPGDPRGVPDLDHLRRRPRTCWPIRRTATRQPRSPSRRRPCPGAGPYRPDDADESPDETCFPAPAFPRLSLPLSCSTPQPSGLLPPHPSLSRLLPHTPAFPPPAPTPQPSRHLPSPTSAFPILRRRHDSRRSGASASPARRSIHVIRSVGHAETSRPAPHRTAPHRTAPHRTAPRVTHRAALRRTALARNAVPRHTAPCPTTPRCTAPGSAAHRSCPATPCRATQRPAGQRRSPQRHALPRRALLLAANDLLARVGQMATSAGMSVDVTDQRSNTRPTDPLPPSGL
jgi:hypothetical protein